VRFFADPPAPRPGQGSRGLGDNAAAREASPSFSVVVHSFGWSNDPGGFAAHPLRFSSGGCYSPWPPLRTPLDAARVAALSGPGSPGSISIGCRIRSRPPPQWFKLDAHHSAVRPPRHGDALREDAKRRRSVLFGLGWVPGGLQGAVRNPTCLQERPFLAWEPLSRADQQTGMGRRTEYRMSWWELWRPRGAMNRARPPLDLAFILPISCSSCPWVCRLAWPLAAKGSITQARGRGARSAIGALRHPCRQLQSMCRLHAHSPAQAVSGAEGPSGVCGFFCCLWVVFCFFSRCSVWCRLSFLLCSVAFVMASHVCVGIVPVPYACPSLFGFSCVTLSLLGFFCFSLTRLFATMLVFSLVHPCGPSGVPLCFVARFVCL